MKYSQEDKSRIIAEVLGLLTAGCSLRKATQLAGIVTNCWYGWCDGDAELATQYARAVDDGADAMADELLDIADSKPEDNVDMTSLKLKVDTRKWLLSKRRPAKYGDRVQLAGDAENPLKVEATIDVGGLSIAALEELANLRKK